ncbi:hypothetical protein [Ruegeria sp. Ofav3-42]|uniref:hypothetical protein n=1 Tax=Ruegeria sp. Ofav3-42 TaxID=2917759 RepID=UPI001EF3F909|nr:hypothetical protein [Ruegeria sp. Ofav3-42]MCG7520857.1 hypothetical protein [Ruegeria sp. Ofav3-42]
MRSNRSAAATGRLITFLQKGFKMRLGAGLVQSDLKNVLANLNDVERNQVPFASSLALNWTGEEVLAENQELMRRVFDRPVRWTLNAFRLERSNKRKLSASVERKSLPGRKFYLEVESEGGPRKRTGIESLIIQNMNYRGRVEAIVPTKNAKRNAAGNVSRAQMNRIVAGVKSQRNGGAAAASTGARTRKRVGYFVAPAGSKLSPGIYERKSRGIRKVMAFSQSAPRYKKRFPMEERGRQVAVRVLPDKMRRAMKVALKSRKK